jgi:hypothetical protein
MTARESLSRAFVLNVRLNKQRERLAALRDLAERVASPTVTGMPRGTDVGKPVERAVIRITEAEDEIAATEEKLAQAKEEVADMIQALDDPSQIKVLAMRFLSFMEWDAVANALGYSRRHVFRLRDEAFEKIDTLAPVNDTPVSYSNNEPPVL